MSAGHEDDDKAWADLVDTFHAGPEPDDTRRWPAAEDVDPPTSTDPRDDSSPDHDSFNDDLSSPYPGASLTLGEQPTRRSPGEEQRGSFGHPSGDEYVSDDDHFVPPNPPPIPRGDRVARWAWAGLITPPCALLFAAVVGWTPSDEVTAVLVGAFIAGFGTLIARMRGHDPYDPNNGAIV